ncbi:hypothetical protein AB4Y40_41180 [Paraburkholderia sp. EG287B]|uniref:hypothetical protein n=1 Tax=Paraburkholderia sp. EG287B TaxID=3237010 RepID=UPI0034D3568E
MKNKHLYLPAAAVTLLCLSSPAWAGNACAALSAIYQSMPVGNPNAPSVMKGLRGALKTCRSQLAALSPAAAASPAAPAADGRFVIFDVPGEDTSYGPVLAAINNAGAVAGYYLDAGFAEHSFLRAPDGTITTFDPPGTACTPGAFCSTAIGITPGGVVMGSYVDLTGGHGYLRTPDGQFQTFDVLGSNNSTDPQGINAAGSVTGVYTGSGGLFHGFLRQANGIYTTFDPPSSSTPGRPISVHRARSSGITLRPTRAWLSDSFGQQMGASPRLMPRTADSSTPPQRLRSMLRAR